MGTAADENTLRTTRTLPFPPDAVYAAFESAEVFASWWGPDGFSNAFEVFEFREGGRWKFDMIGPEGKRYANLSEFVVLEPGAKVVIRHIASPHYVLTVTLTPVAGGTQVDWAQAFDDPRFVPAMRHIIGPANEQNLDRLTRALGDRLARG